MSKVRDLSGTARDTDGMATSAGILLRVSSDGQDEENQRPELDAYCYEHSYRVNREYQAHDLSAYHGEHEEWLEQVLADIRVGYIQVLVVVHSSRLDRRDPDVAEFYHLLVRQAGGRIESVREPQFGKSDIAGRVITMLAQYSNHDYSKTLSGNVRAGHDRIRRNREANGVGLFGRAPFGYEIQGEKYSKILVPSPLGVKYVPQMFDRIIRGESLATVAAWLNAEGVPTGTSKPQARYSGQVPRWHPATVSAVIRNTVYKGQMRKDKHLNNGDYFGRCESLVSAAIWRAANARLDSAPTRRGPVNNEKRATLASLLFCEHCGSAMYRSTSGPTRVYYRCAGKVTGTSCFMVRLAVIDAAVDAAMTGNAKRIMRRELIPGRNYDDDIDAIRAQVRSLDIDAPDYDERHAALMTELRRLRDLDTTPDRWELRPTSETWGGRWTGLSAAERGAWLAQHGFRVTPAKAEVVVRLRDRWARRKLPLGA